ncbi:basic membrane protein A [Aequitasia blattaphilus]|uniref:BMP family ABC transporter substrate-binding protein n=1 Tax=Aequitasia blattaphilus TaxID=2949332 RepID=A0ABT1E7X3_9FIRM|nr:BMP family ABC transporter substrate-binding protein [Aequitasia blattaphilus]MCP1101930.1 BMP family ABC transporter substrate-binding protein [Aequitasia blattaphilus]MCR8614570.1 BMP family ABC transporter substrate-binding protein [Aequitasia blattaphilus]
MKKILSVLLVAVMCFSLVACGGSDSDSGASGGSSDEKGKDKIRVCIVYTGNLGDKSYNDSCNEGAQRAVEELGVEVKSLEGATAEEWESNLVSACEEGYDLIIGASSNIADYITEHGPNYPETKFAVIDTTVDLDNVQSISFAQNQGSFLAGAAAAMFTTKTDIEGVNKEKIIGWVGGMDIPVLHDFYTGYEQGAKYIDPDIKILQAFAGTWTDPLKGKELTLAQYEQGADIVMNVASGTGPGILEAAKEAGKYAIGVDLNQDNDQPGSILTSMVKRVDNACYLVIESVVNDTFAGGTTQYLSLEEGGVSLTDFAVIKESLGDKFPQDIVDKCDELAEKIIAGEIVVENYEGFGPEAQ